MDEVESRLSLSGDEGAWYQPPHYKAMNYAVVSYTKNYKPTHGKKGEMRLIGIYPTYNESNFIRGKLNDGNIITIEKTKNEPTTLLVGEYLKGKDGI